MYRGQEALFHRKGGRENEEKKDLAAQGIALKKFGITKSTFTFFGADFDFNPIWAFVGGIIIAAISSFLGVGGGFLYVPYLTSLVGAPMFVVAGTSAMAVLLSMITSIASYITVAKAGMDYTVHFLLTRKGIQIGYNRTNRRVTKND